jgi:hypothetical protein
LKENLKFVRGSPVKSKVVTQKISAYGSGSREKLAPLDLSYDKKHPPHTYIFILT